MSGPIRSTRRPSLMRCSPSMLGPALMPCPAGLKTVVEVVLLLVVVELEDVDVFDVAGLLVVAPESEGGMTIALLVGAVDFTGPVRWMRTWAWAGRAAGSSKPPIDSAEAATVNRVFRCIGVSFLMLV